MKLITNISLVAMALAVIGSSAALADDPQLRNRLDLQRAQTEAVQPAATVAVYAGQRGISAPAMVQVEPAGSHFELRTDAHGHTFGMFVPNE